MQTMRVTIITLAISCAAATASAQTPPPVETLPRANPVTDPARPDFGYMQPWAGTVFTVVAVLRPDCAACEASVPFYKRLATLPGIDHETRRFVVMTQGGIGPVAMMIEKHPSGFRARPAVSFPDDGRLQVTELPSIVVFDGRWKERGRWAGQLTRAQEDEVLALLRTLDKGGSR
jgi:hypothetical protein